MQISYLVMKMKRIDNKAVLAMLLAAIGFTACQESSEKTAQDVSPSAPVAGKPTPNPDISSESTGKPSAPISMKYEILGNPVVGQPVAINVEVRSTSGNHPVTVQYSINDSSALVFQAGQVERLQVTANAEKTASQQQLAVIPQREGRLYVNVSAEIQTPDGTMIKSMAIPIQVGSARAKPEINGELVEGPDGETVISMPAKEN
jgi:hypothetical protein